MCGRLNIHNRESIYELMRMFTEDVIDHADIRYNISPGASLASLYHKDHMQAVAMHWGLIPLWAKPGVFKKPLINARAETVFEKPSFRSLVKSHRCVVPVNGFYEWQRSESGKTPFHFQRADESVMLLGGLFQFNKQGQAECCLITTAADDVMAPVHDRMPVVLEHAQIDDWLRSDDRPLLESVMRPPASSVLSATQVSRYVNRADNDGAQCIEAVSEDN